MLSRLAYTACMTAKQQPKLVDVRKIGKKGGQARGGPKLQRRNRRGRVHENTVRQRARHGHGRRRGEEPPVAGPGRGKGKSRSLASGALGWLVGWLVAFGGRGGGGSVRRRVHGEAPAEVGTRWPRGGRAPARDEKKAGRGAWRLHSPGGGGSGRRRRQRERARVSAWRLCACGVWMCECFVLCLCAIGVHRVRVRYK